MSCNTERGAEMVLQRAFPGAVAEASTCSDSYHCGAIAATDSLVQALPKPTFMASLAAEPTLAKNS